MFWKDNTIMDWSDGVSWFRISDHGRAPLDVSYERIEFKNRMADATLRRYVVDKKRTWAISWENLPARTEIGALNTADGGLDGDDIEKFYFENDGAFEIKIRNGNGQTDRATVMITDFSKTIVKRGVFNDLWNLDISLEEC